MNRIDISLDLYQLFCAVVETGNMSAAAKKLFISQPAVSMAIRQLEASFGKALLVRSSKGVRPTPEGQVLYDYVSQGLRLIHTAEKKYFEMADLTMGEIRVGASDTILTYYLLPYIEQYVQKYTAIHIKATNKTTVETLTLLKSGKVDIGFIHLPIPEDDNIETIECLALHDCVVGGANYRGLAQKGMSVTEMNNFPLMLLEPESSTRQFFDHYARVHGVLLRPNIELGSNDLLLNFAKMNLGITFATKEFIRPLLEQGVLFEIPIKEPIPARAVGLAKLKGVPFSYATDKFVAFLSPIHVKDKL